jgi:hypothetical protein
VKFRATTGALALVLAVCAAGCGSGGGGSATLWVTRDQGRHVLLAKSVPAGLTAMQALDRESVIRTRYGGRYVQSIDGLAGSLTRRHDWFFFVNGIEADRGAAEYRLHAGDVEWWDYRDWGRYGEHVPVVVGAFPEPFLHGFGGTVRPAYVIGSGPGARAIARAIRGRVARSAPRGANVFRIASGAPRFAAHARSGGGYEFVFAGDAARLARDPASVRYRYRLP